MTDAQERSRDKWVRGTDPPVRCPHLPRVLLQKLDCFLHPRGLPESHHACGPAPPTSGLGRGHHDAAKQCHSKVTGQETCFEVSLLPLAAVGSGELSSSQGLSSAA